MHKDLPKWQGKTILHSDHGVKLDLAAAALEFNHNMPRKEAEEKAYKDYMGGHRIAAAAHHYVGMKAALAANDQDSAKKHSMMYSAHLKALGHDPVGPVPKEVQEHMAKNPVKIYRFMPSAGDVFNLS